MDSGGEMSVRVMIQKLEIESLMFSVISIYDP